MPQRASISFSITSRLLKIEKSEYSLLKKTWPSGQGLICWLCPLLSFPRVPRPLSCPSVPIGHPELKLILDFALQFLSLKYACKDLRVLGERSRSLVLYRNIVGLSFTLAKRALLRGASISKT